MSNPNHSAFPLACNYGAGDEVTYGLNKREYFAAMAMQGLLADGAVDMAPALASLSVKYADALLAELAKS
jgi:hypothetical protein